MKTVSVETALEEIRAVLAEADSAHGCDCEMANMVAVAYSVLCAGEDETVSVVTGDKTASNWYRDGRVCDAATD